MPIKFTFVTCMYSSVQLIKNARKITLPSFSNALSFATGDFYGGSTTLSASFSNHKSSEGSKSNPEVISRTAWAGNQSCRSPQPNKLSLLMRTGDNHYKVAVCIVRNKQQLGYSKMKLNSVQNRFIFRPLTPAPFLRRDGNYQCDPL